MEDFIQAPPEGAVTKNTDRVNALRVQFSTLKTPEAYVAAVTDEFMAGQVRACKLGFHYYSKEQNANQFLQPFSFVLLEVYSGVGGVVDNGGGDFTQYYSNRVKDTRIEEIVLYSSTSKAPVAKGLYKELKDQNVLPGGVGYQMYALAYCVELAQPIEIPIGGRVSTAMQEAVSAAETSQGRKTAPKAINMFSLADTVNLWGFRLTGYERQNKKGDAYKDGELYFAPIFFCGVVRETASFYAEAVAIQQQARAYHSAGVERRLAKAYAEHDATKDQNAPKTEFPAAPVYQAAPPVNNAPFPVDEFVPANATDDLPF